MKAPDEVAYYYSGYIVVFIMRLLIEHLRRGKNDPMSAVGQFRKMNRKSIVRKLEKKFMLDVIKHQKRYDPATK